MADAASPCLMTNRRQRILPKVGRGLFARDLRARDDGEWQLIHPPAVIYRSQSQH